MSLIPWNPFSELDDFLDRYNRNVGRPADPDRKGLADWSPRVDISETDAAFVVKADLPGLEHKDVIVEVSNGLLTIKGERVVEKKEENETYHRVERSHGAFSRSFSLPETVATDDIEATFKDGQLILELPKTEPKGPEIKQIAVK